MRYYSTNRRTGDVTLKEAVIKGLAADKGLFMPAKIGVIPSAFIRNMGEMTLPEIAFAVANTLFGDDADAAELQRIVYDALDFDIPLRHVSGNRYVLELFHGPTLAFKDVGARFMARLLGYFNRMDVDRCVVNVLVATSGDTGSAVANGFLDVPGVRVYVLYPSGKVSQIQESQFTTLGHNISAVEVEGTFDDCQRLVKEAFMDVELNQLLKLTSANSINIARFLPQTFYYFYAYAQLEKMEAGCLDNVVVAVPSGNLGNLTAGLVAKKMGLPIKRFIAANNRNDVFSKYLNSGEYRPTKSVPTIANAMDVGDPSNFARILDLYGNSHTAVTADVSGFAYTDVQIGETIIDTYQKDGYLLDPHGATGYRALLDHLGNDEVGVCLETAHPAKFKESIDSMIGHPIELPSRLAAFMGGEKRTVRIPADFAIFKAFLKRQ